MKHIIAVAILGLIVSSFAIGLMGCTKSHKIDRPDVDLTPQQVLVRTVEKTDWLATIGILGIGLSVFAILSGNTKFGIAGTGGFTTILVMSLATARYHQQLAFYGVIVSTVGLSLFLAYSIFIKNKALREIIKNVQDFRGEFSTADLIVPYLRTQSPSTKDIVKSVKEKL